MVTHIQFRGRKNKCEKKAFIMKMCGCETVTNFVHYFQNSSSLNKADTGLGRNYKKYIYFSILLQL